MRRPANRNQRRSAEKNSPAQSGLSGYFAQVDWQNVRFYLAASLFVVVWAALWCRAFYVQLIQGPDLANRAERQHTYTELVEARRGTIYDRNGHALARSVECRSIYANPHQVENVDAAVSVLSALLPLNPITLKEQLLQNRSFVWLARKVDDATAQAIQQADIPGIGLSREYERVYPYKHMAGQLLGFVGLDNTGLEGLERSFDEVLAGSDKKNVVTRDASGRGFYQGDTEDNNGKDIHLTLDVQIQFIAEEVISEAVEGAKAKWGGVLVMDVASGGVLAWAQYPFFNPNNFRQTPPDIYRNRLAADALEPGSTFKPFLIGAALEEKIITPESVFFCENGSWTTKLITIGDDGRAYGDLTVDKILRYSSNIGMAKIALEVGVPTFHSYLGRLGFGRRTGIGVGENKGIVRIPRDWSEADLMSAAFGQSVSMTGIQMAQGYMVIANGGMLRPPRLIMDEAGHATGADQKVFSKATSDTLLEMLNGVVDADGTGKRARIPGVRVAGKTGTAQKAHRGKTAGYGDDRLASFAGIVPADDPRYVILVMLDEPSDVKYGGTLAAPVFQRVASRTLSYGGYLPDVVFNLEAPIFVEEEPAAKPLPPLTKKPEKANNKKQNAAPTKKQGKKPEALPVQLPDIAKNIAPDVQGKSVRRAIELFAASGTVPKVEGTGNVVVRQAPEPGQPYVVDGQKVPCILWLSE